MITILTLDRVISPSQRLVWLFTILLLAVAIGLSVLLRPIVPLIVFIPVLGAVALLGGWRAGLIALVASNAVVAWFLAPDPGSVVLTQPSILVRSLLFLTVGGVSVALMSALAGLVRRLLAAQRLQAALMQELQHRVANNMQVIGASLRAARHGVADPVALAALDATAARADAMALMHRRLYDPATYANGLRPILEDVLAEVFDGLDVTTRLELEPCALSIERAMSALLLINEAALNAAKHAFRPGLGRTFTVELRQAGDAVALRIEDDGPGVPPPVAAVPLAADRAGKGLGLGIMQGLARQLGGTLDVTASSGTRLEVTFQPG